MKKILNIALFVITTSITNLLNAQITPYLQEVTVNNEPIYNCSLIHFGNNTTLNLSFKIKITKTSNIDVGNYATFRLYILRNSDSTPQLLNQIMISNANYWNNGTLWEQNFNQTIHRDDIDVNGSILYGVYEVSDNIKPKTCEYPLEKTPPPSFSFSPTSLSIPCGDIISRTFKVTPANIPIGATVTYQWSVGAGWSGTYDTSMSSIILTPSANSPLGNISVVPKINGVSQATKSCTVTRPAFTTTATISGAPTFCSIPSTSTYTINAGTGNTVSWSSSNTSIATVSSQTNSQVTLTVVAPGTVQLKGTITNPCGQTASVEKEIIIYNIGTLPTPSGYLTVGPVDCYNDGPVDVLFVPNNSFGGVISVNPPMLPHPLRSQRRTYTVRYTNPCTGAYTSRTYVYNYQAPNCSNARLSNGVTTTYTVFPNPSNDIVNIELRDEKNQPERDAKISGELFDLLGLSKTKVEITDNKAILSVRGLNKGIYVLKIYINDQVETHQIAVE